MVAEVVKDIQTDGERGSVKRMVKDVQPLMNGTMPIESLALIIQIGIVLNIPTMNMETYLMRREWDLLNAP